MRPEDLFFLQVQTGAGPVLPYQDEDEEAQQALDADAAEAAERARLAEEEEKKRAAQRQMEDFTRNIQRKKDKEMAALQFVGGSGTPTETKQASSDKKAGRNDPCPCGSGKKYKKCHGA